MSQQGVTLTGTIEEVISGRKFDAEIRRVRPGDVRRLSANWNFDWMAEVLERDVYQLIVPSINRDIQGLISVDRMDRFIHVNLIENHPDQVGRQKELAGIAGSLMAFVADLSFAAGFDGYLSFEAKSELMLHYETAFGARRIGRTNRMVIDNFAAKQLIAKHFGDKHGNDS